MSPDARRRQACDPQRVFRAGPHVPESNLPGDSPLSPPSQGQPLGRPELMRRADGRLIAGVGVGLARTFGVPVLPVRVALAVLVASGIGVGAYIALWLLLPVDDAARDAPKPWRVARVLRQVRRQPGALREVVVLAVVGSLGRGLLGLLGVPLGGAVEISLSIAVVGAVVIWRRAPDERRQRWTADASRYGALVSRRGWDVSAVALGITLVVVGVGAFLAANDALAQASSGALALGAVLVGAVLVAGPWLLRLVRELQRERRTRIREQERLEVAAHVHDSVLQTLVLLQARAGDPATVRQLARQQERELRAWLFDGARSAEAATLAGGLREAVAEVEDAHGVGVELVVVGDAPLDDALAPLVAATREAVVNAAKASGAARISVFVEVDEHDVRAWVRDRGCGFVPEDVPADRHGLRDSVVGRMARAGGRACVRSAPGEGTEIELVLSRPPGTDA